MNGILHLGLLKKLWQLVSFDEIASSPTPCNDGSFHEIPVFTGMTENFLNRHTALDAVSHDW